MVKIVDSTILLLEERLSELQPAVDEYNEVRDAIARLRQEPSAPRTERRSTRQREIDAVLYIQDNPGCRSTDIAKDQRILDQRASQILGGLVERRVVQRTADGLQLGSERAVEDLLGGKASRS